MRRGFTLIETLTVVAIVAVLAGIAFPVFASARGRGDHAACAARLHSLGLATTLYANDHDDWVPPASTAEDFYLGSQNPAPVEAVRESPRVLRRALDRYVRNDEVWYCPADHFARRAPLVYGQRHRWTSYHFLPLTQVGSRAWPPRMRLGRDSLSATGEDVPLFCDAVGFAQEFDTDPAYRVDDGRAKSNHSDRTVNAIRHDLSAYRMTAAKATGSPE